MIGNAIPDIPRIYTALAEWLSCVMLVVLLKPKIPKGRLVMFTVLYLVVLMAFMELTGTVVLWMWLPCMLAAFISMAGYIHLCTKVNFFESVYYTALAFSVAELMASLEWQVVHLLYSDSRWLNSN